MIKYNLKCHNNHEFESWFSDSNEFDKLNKKKLLDCIYCSSKRITKSIMAPMVSVVKKNTNNSTKLNKNLASEKENLLKLRKFIEKNFEYVGKDFSKKVREIYYDKKSKKTIYGTTTKKGKRRFNRRGYRFN